MTGKTCAVMGPSGAGKTTFLSILAGKIAKTDGSIKVNGKEQTLSLWKKLVGFVPQEDVMLSDLTVREILMVRNLSTNVICNVLDRSCRHDNT